MVKSIDIGGLVGSGLFFAAVSRHMAHALPIGHEMGLRSDSHAASGRPGSFTAFSAEFVANERAVGFLGYDSALDNKSLVLAGERVLLGVLPTCAVLGSGFVCRSSATDSAFFKDATTGDDVEFTSYAKLNEVACSLGLSAFMRTVAEPADDVLAATKLPLNATAGGDGFAVFPRFDLFASRIGKGRVTDEEHSYPTIKLASSTGMGAAGSDMDGADRFMVGEIASCEDWLVWMQPVADIPLKSFMHLSMDLLVAGK